MSSTPGGGVMKFPLMSTPTDVTAPSPASCAILAPLPQPASRIGKSGDVTDESALRGPLDESIERVLAGAGLLEARGERLPRTARVAAVRAGSAFNRVSHARSID